jgi:hypothetical protein
MKNRTNVVAMKLDRRMLRLVRRIESHLAEDESGEELEGRLSDVMRTLSRTLGTDYALSEIVWAVGVAEARRFRARPPSTLSPVIVPFNTPLRKAVK